MARVEFRARGGALRGAVLAAALAAELEAPISSASSDFFFAFALRDFADEKNSFTFCKSGTGQIHAQNARPTRNTRMPMITMETTARGMNVFVAIIVVNAPSGQSAAICCQPKPESVPRPT